MVRVGTRWLPTYLTYRSIGRSTTWKITTTPSLTRTYFGWMSTNLRQRWSVRTSSSIAWASKIWPARVTSLGSFETSVAWLPSIRTSTIRLASSTAPAGGRGTTLPGDWGTWPWAAAIQSPASASHADSCASRRRKPTETGRPADGANKSGLRLENTALRSMRGSINGADEGKGGNGPGRNTGATDCVTRRKVSE